MHQALLAHQASRVQTYARDLRNILKQVAAGTKRALVRHLTPVESVGRVHPRTDAVGPGPSGRLSQRGGILDLLGIKVQTHVQGETTKAFNRMAKDVDQKNARAMRLVGIPQAKVSTQPTIDAFRKANVDLMLKAGSTYIEQVRGVLEAPENEGLRVEELAALIDERTDVGQSHAELIARDQTLKLNANLSQDRMKGAGVTQYTWSTSNDDRVRPMHADLDGKTFSFSDPPVTDDDGNTNNPGEDFQCRCVALPLIEFDALE